MSFNPFKKRLLICLSVVAACVTGFSQNAAAATASISGQNSNEFVQTVQGTYVYNTTISFDEPGAYKITLTDFNFPNTFDALGVMVSTAKDKVVDVVSYDHEGSLSKYFNADAGQYYMSLFAVSDRQLNLGSFGLVFDAASPAEVPLPPALILLMSGVMTLMGFARRRQIA